VAGERFQRYGAYAENMEGSAVAHACRRFETPMVECRGISNVAGIRAKETWQLEKSIAHCHGIIINWLEALNSVKVQH
jgi:futalosine hydrolase